MSMINANKHLLVVPTDKTNSFRVLKNKTYYVSVKGHLLKSGEEVNRARIIEIYGNAHILLKQNQEALLKTEYHAIRSAIEKHNILTPKLLVKKLQETQPHYRPIPDAITLSSKAIHLNFCKNRIPWYQENL